MLGWSIDLQNRSDTLFHQTAFRKEHVYDANAREMVRVALSAFAVVKGMVDFCRVRRLRHYTA